MKLLYYILVLAILCLAWALIEAQLYKVKRIWLKSKKIKGRVKIAFISDIHYGDYYRHGRLRKIVKRINELKPDVIVIGGDCLDIAKNGRLKRHFLDELLDDLSLLKSKHGILTVLGNHEYCLGDDLPLMLEKLKENNILLLNNETREIKLDNDILTFHGVDDLLEGSIDTTRLSIKEAGLNILMSHNPDFFEQYDVNFDIGLSGHTHGGQVTFFGLYAPVTESRYGQKYVKTLNERNGSTVITSKGLGCSGLPIRFFAVPEIIELTIGNR